MGIKMTNVKHLNQRGGGGGEKKYIKNVVVGPNTSRISQFLIPKQNDYMMYVNLNLLIQKQL